MADKKNTLKTVAAVTTAAVAGAAAGAAAAALSDPKNRKKLAKEAQHAGQEIKKQAQKGKVGLSKWLDQVKNIVNDKLENLTKEE